MPNIEDHTKLVHYIIHKKFPGYVGDEDVFQCGMIGLWLACETYDETRGEFCTLACKTIFTEIVKYLRIENRQSRINAISLDTPISEDNPITIGELIPDKRDYISEHMVQAALQEAYDEMSDKDQEFFRCTLTDASPGDTISNLGISREWHRQRRNKAVNDIRRRISEVV